MTPDQQSFEITLDNRLHTVWEKAETLALSIYTANIGWIDGRPTTAPRTLRRMSEEFLAVASELDAIARDVEVEDKRFAESQFATVKAFAQSWAEFERDQLTKRLGEIVQTARKPSGSAP
jgi:hypothetical protein